jgi:hypothetical protein
MGGGERCVPAAAAAMHAALARPPKALCAHPPAARCSPLALRPQDAAESEVENATSAAQAELAGHEKELGELQVGGEGRGRGGGTVRAVRCRIARGRAQGRQRCGVEALARRPRPAVCRRARAHTHARPPPSIPTQSRLSELKVILYGRLGSGNINLEE